MGQRDTQLATEAAIAAASALARGTQLVAEAAVGGTTSALSRGTQLVAEAAVFATNELPRVTQLVVEVVIQSGQPGYPPGAW